MDDEHIIQLLWSRTENAIDALCHRFGARLLLTAKNFLGDEDAEECVNDTYLAIWNAIPPRQPQPLAPFVFRVGRNIALNRLRSQSAQKRGGYVLSLDELSACIPAPALSNRELSQALSSYLATLNSDNRILFMRRYWFGDSVRDLSREFAMTENAVSVRLNRIRNGLRNYLIEEGYDL